MLSSGVIFDGARNLARVEQLDHDMAQPGFFSDTERMKQASQERSRAASFVERDRLHARAFEECSILLEMLEDGEPVEEDLTQALGRLMAELDADETKTLMSGPHDQAGAIICIHPGAGGVDAQDWAEMLLRMYLRWCETKGLQATVLERQAGEEAGIKSATVQVRGDFAYGNLRTETGVHRLIRMSPFDAQGRRHTAFASMHAFPDIAEDIEIDIDDKDLRVDTYRSSGAGGQHVNVTDSAIRITHLPTGIVVTCQNERSQHKNRDSAMRVLKVRLYEREVEAQEEAIRAAAGEKKKVDFGSQIRSYFMHPSQRVKDHRTGVEVGSITAVLDGDLDGFIQAYLTRRTDGALAQAGPDE